MSNEQKGLSPNLIAVIAGGILGMILWATMLTPRQSVQTPPPAVTQQQTDQQIIGMLTRRTADLSTRVATLERVLDRVLQGRGVIEVTNKETGQVTRFGSEPAETRIPGLVTPGDRRTTP